MFLGRLRFVLHRHQLTHFDKILTNYPQVKVILFPHRKQPTFLTARGADTWPANKLLITDVNKNPAGKSFNHSATIPPVCFLPPTSIQNVK